MRIEHDTERCRFTAYGEDGRRMGEIGYSRRDGNLAAMHTRVEDEFRGKGVAGGLLDALAAYAESEGVRITPVCSYVVAAFERDPARYGKVIGE